MRNLDEWLASLQERDEPPTPEHTAFLRSVIRRLTVEARAEQRKKVEKEDGEPLFDMVHGVPGAGKGMLIGWLREAFEEVLGWVHGVQFVCLAFQNAMAALIQGYTIHHWSGIPVNDTDGMGTTRDMQKLSTKCQCLRFILIDEISMVSAQLLGQLELVISKVARRRGLYKLRSDGTSRPFGGVNTLLFGDWWQLKPVSGTALFADPASASGGVTAHGLQLMWGEPPNAVHRCWDFTQSLRCGDQWYNSILSQCRAGNMHVEAYRFLNGFPTASPTSLAKDTSRDPSCTCAGSCDNDGFYIPWVQDFITRGVPGAGLVAKECPICTMQRARRGRVLDMEALPTQELDHAPFDTAPALYAYNVPRYYTLMQRSRKYARINALRLSWCFAKDLPLQREDRDLTQEQLDAKRRLWLQFHDQQTAHIASQVPLARGLPVRLTDAVDRERSLFRGRRGVIVGWAPHPMEESIEVDGELLLTKQPLAIYIHFPKATWTIHEDLGVGVYPLTAKSRTWLVNRQTKVKARRTGFFLVPDFASTAHMI